MGHTVRFTLFQDDSPISGAVSASSFVAIQRFWTAGLRTSAAAQPAATAEPEVFRAVAAAAESAELWSVAAEPTQSEELRAAAAEPADAAELCPATSQVAASTAESFFHGSGSCQKRRQAGPYAIQHQPGCKWF